MLPDTLEVNVLNRPSTGKSSVLESLTGIDFPRSENTCTRCPTIVRVQPSPGDSNAPYAFVSTDPAFDGKNPTTTHRVNLSQIGSTIEQLTETLAGDRVLIAEDPIHIKVVRPLGPTFTLIDLPGNNLDIIRLFRGLVFLLLT